MAVPTTLSISSSCSEVPFPLCAEKTAPAVQSPALAPPLTGFMTLEAANSSRLDAAHSSGLHLSSPKLS